MTLSASLVALMEAYRDAGAARATIADLEVTRLDSTSAIATVRWNALAGDGALLRDFVTSYQMLHEESGGWRILSYTCTWLLRAALASGSGED